MGSHHSTSANRAPRATKCASVIDDDGDVGGCGPNLPQLLRLSNDSASSQTNGHSNTTTNPAGICKRISMPSLQANKMTSNGKTNQGKDGGAHRSSSGKTSEKIISTLDKKVHQLVRESRASGLIGGDKLQLKSCSAKNGNNQSNNSGNYNYHYAQSFNQDKEANTRQRTQRGVSVGDSDVFIYPSNYRDMNECQKCARDNKICNCNLIEAASATPRSNSTSSSQSDCESSPSRDNTTTTSQTNRTNINNNNNGATTEAQQQQQQEEAEGEKDEVKGASKSVSCLRPRERACDNGRLTRDSSCKQHQTSRARELSSVCEHGHCCVCRSGRDDSQDPSYRAGLSCSQKKKVFKISVASLKQKSNRMRFPKPKIVSHSQPSADIQNVCPSQRLHHHQDRTTNNSNPHQIKRSTPGSDMNNQSANNSSVVAATATATTTGGSDDEGLNQTVSQARERVPPPPKEEQECENHDQERGKQKESKESNNDHIHRTQGASRVANNPVLCMSIVGNRSHEHDLSSFRWASRAKSIPIQTIASHSSVTKTTTTTSFRTCHIIEPHAASLNDLIPSEQVVCSDSRQGRRDEREICFSQIEGLTNSGQHQDTGGGLYRNLVSECDNVDYGDDAGAGYKMNGDEITGSTDLVQKLVCNLAVSNESTLTSATSIQSFGRQGELCLQNAFDEPAMSESLAKTDTFYSSETATRTSLRYTVSERRKNSASKQNDRKIICVLDENNNNSLAVCERSFNVVDDLQVDTSNSYDERSNNNNNPDVSIQGYSPILSSVRDYIENVNPELRMHHSQSINLAPSSAFGNLITSCEQQQQPKTTIAVVDIIGNVPAIELQPRPSDVVVQTSVAAAVITSRTICTSGGIVASPNGMVSDRADGGGTCGTPKKSIFEGASKDEILEYLEDARERVPEVLIAADDVMVIGENELIVVNQLDPSSPATPISVSERTDREVICNGRVDEGNVIDGRISQALQNQMSGQSQSPESEELELTTTQSSNFDGGKHEESDLFRGLSSNIATDDNSSDTQTNSELQETSDPRYMSYNQSSYMSDDQELKDHRDIIAQVAEGADVQAKVTAPRRIALLASTSSRSNTSCGNTSLDASGSPFSQDNQPLADYSSNTNNSVALINDSPVPAPLIANDLCSFTEQSRKSELQERERRKSTSESCSRFLQEENRQNILQLMLLRQQQPKQNSACNHHQESVYSPPSSSSPPSSNSESTCASQTSGNCTAVSTFYASSSLSCSSPFLASNLPSHLPTTLTAAVTAPDSPASNQLQHADSSVTNSDQAAQFGRQAQQVERNDSGLGSESQAQYEQQRRQSRTSINRASNPRALDADRRRCQSPTSNELTKQNGHNRSTAGTVASKSDYDGTLRVHNGGAAHTSTTNGNESNQNGSRSNVIEETAQDRAAFSLCHDYTQEQQLSQLNGQTNRPAMTAAQPKSAVTSNSNSSPPAAAPCGLVARPLHSHYATMNRFNSYLTNRHGSGATNSENLNDHSMIEFQCLDCDQLICVDHARMLDATNEIKQLRENYITRESMKDRPMTSDQLERAYVVAMNGLPLCKSCEKKRTERKEIVSEFVETELKYGRDLKIIHDEFYRPMQIAGLLNKDQINGVFLNLDELIMAHCRFADRLGAAISEALAINDTDYNTVNIGKLFVESADMLHTFESYCIRQGSAACLLARLAKEKELLRIFLRVSQMENTLLRRMNLAAFLMVPVQRVTKYPLLLNRLYKVTPYHHKDREALRDAQLKVELHLEHINQQTKGISATNKIWRRISNLSAPNSNNRRGMINAEDIGYIKLRKVAMDILKWDRDETQFIHSGKLNFALLNEYLTKQRAKPMRYMAAHALLIVLGKPNWKYRPDLVKSNLDSKLMVPTTGGTGIKEAALLLFREKNGRFVACRDPLLLSNCVLSNDCSQYNNDQCLPVTNQQFQQQQQQQLQQQRNHGPNRQLISAISLNHHDQLTNAAERKSLPGLGTPANNSSCTSLNKTNSKDNNLKFPIDSKATSVTVNNSSSKHGPLAGRDGSHSSGSSRAMEYFKMNKSLSHSKGSDASGDLVLAGGGGDANQQQQAASTASSVQVDSVSMSSLKSLPEEQLLNSGANLKASISPPTQPTPRSYSLASALPRTPITTASANSNSNLTKTNQSGAASSNLTILNQLMSKVNNYHHGTSKQHNNVTESRSTHDSSVTTMAKTMSFSHCDDQLLAGTKNGLISTQSIDNLSRVSNTNQGLAPITTMASGKTKSPKVASGGSTTTTINETKGSTFPSGVTTAGVDMSNHHHYNHHFFHNHQPYGDYEESFELHERISKESLLLRADTPLKTRYWLQMLRYHAKDLGQWRARRNGLANIMMMRQE